jgi:NYN domain
MKAQSTGPILSTVFVDYDNIYLSLKRKNEEAAKRFAKDAGHWIREIASGRLITSTNGTNFLAERRISMNRCYGNPVPRRNSSDNSTDMNSFPFVRHHFLRSGFEVIDCPPLTAQLKNSADIRMVMDVRDILNHDTYFDEFIILSGDADFTPVLHRLRAHARRSVVFANDHTAAPYTAISDGEVRESDLISLLMEGRVASAGGARPAIESNIPSAAQLESMRKSIVAEVVSSVRSAAAPVPLEALADRAVRTLGHENTVGSAWGGTGSFRDLLTKTLPGDVKLSEQPPYVAYDTSRQITAEPAQAPAPVSPRPAPARETRADLPLPTYDRSLGRGVSAPAAAARSAYPAAPSQPAYQGQPAAASQRAVPPMAGGGAASYPEPSPAAQQQSYPGLSTYTPASPTPSYMAGALDDDAQASRAAASSQLQARGGESATALQQSISRIHDACQAPPLSPPEYRVLFEVMAEEINANSLAGSQTITNIAQRARDSGLDARRDDVRFVLEVVSEADPWFEQGASANLFASRFRNFVVARCRSQSLNLSSDEIDLIDAWFGGATPSQRGAQDERPIDYSSHGYQQQAPAQAPPAATQPAGDRWAPPGTSQNQGGAQASGFGAPQDEEFPRIVRTRLRG